MENLKPYHPLPPEVGPSHEAQPPELVEGEEEFEVEDILAHCLVGPHKQPEFLVCLKGYTVAALPAHQYSCYPAAWRSLQLKEGACYTAHRWFMLLLLFFADFAKTPRTMHLHAKPVPPAA